MGQSCTRFLFHTSKRKITQSTDKKSCDTIATLPPKRRRLPKAKEHPLYFDVATYQIKDQKEDKWFIESTQPVIAEHMEKLRSKAATLRPLAWNQIGQWVLVNRVIDGDTVEIVHRDPSSPEYPIFLKSSLRLAGIDAPEMDNYEESREVKTKKRAKPKTATLEGEAASKVRKVLVSLLEKTRYQAYVIFDKSEKYGRAMGYLFVHHPNMVINVQQFLVHKKLAKTYSGKKKSEWQPSELEFICKQDIEVLIQ